MRVTVRYFAILRESIGRAREERELPLGASVQDLLDRIQADVPLVGGLRASSMLMVNQEYVSPDHELHDGDEFALIPPVAGGSESDGAESRFAIVAGPLDQTAIAAKVADPSAGAVVTFVGTVRNQARGREVVALEYEAYPEAAEKILAKIGDEITERWGTGIERVAISHRTGRLDVGEASVVIAVASPHRTEAFDACRYAIERIKQIVPIWKKEFYADGETWIGSEAAYQELYGTSTGGNAAR